jgi:hypothetical protein
LSYCPVLGRMIHSFPEAMYRSRSCCLAITKHSRRLVIFIFLQPSPFAFNSIAYDLIHILQCILHNIYAARHSHSYFILLETVNIVPHCSNDDYTHKMQLLAPYQSWIRAKIWSPFSERRQALASTEAGVAVRCRLCGRDIET